MRFSRQFVEILNTAVKLETDKGLLRMRQIVEQWSQSGELDPKGVQWLNSRSLRHRTVLRPVTRGHTPETSLELESQDPGLERIAASSFAEFVTEVGDSRTTGAGRLAVKICPGCQELFVQEDSGREKLVCSGRCKFRLRRQAQRDTKTRTPRKRRLPGRGEKSG